MNDLNQSGIYQIKNKINNLIYVGSAKNVKKRISKHFSSLKLNKHGNNHLQSAYNLYGSENFEVSIIEIVIDTKALIEREQYWIDKLNVCNDKIGYNMSPTAGSSLGRKFSNESKAKISNSLKKYFKNNKNPFKGKSHTEESKEIMRNKNKLKKPIINKTTGEVFSSIAEASRKYNVTVQSVSNNLRKATHSSAGCEWEYLDNNTISRKGIEQ